MNKPVSTLMKAIPPTLIAIGMAVVAFGAAYQQWAADNPDQAAWLGIPVVGVGAIAALVGMVLNAFNVKKNEEAVPLAPHDDNGDPQDSVTHLVSLAISQAILVDDYVKAEKLLDVIKPEVKP